MKEKESVMMTVASLVATGVLDWQGLEMVRKVRSQYWLLSQEGGVGVHVFRCLRDEEYERPGK